MKGGRPVRGLPDPSSIQRWISSRGFGAPPTLRRWMESHRWQHAMPTQRPQGGPGEHRTLRRFTWRRGESPGDLPDDLLEKVRHVSTIESWRSLVERSFDSPVLVYRHSTSCPVSSFASHEIKVFLERASCPPDLVVGLVKIPESVEVSNRVADDTGVLCQSPQVILLDHGRAIWHTSHGGISVEALAGAVSLHVAV
jgi:bacillithiol system protein YtxJ